MADTTKETDPSKDQTVEIDKDKTVEIDKDKTPKDKGETDYQFTKEDYAEKTRDLDKWKKKARKLEADKEARDKKELEENEEYKKAYEKEKAINEKLKKDNLKAVFHNKLLGLCDSKDAYPNSVKFFLEASDFDIYAEDANEKLEAAFDKCLTDNPNFVKASDDKINEADRLTGKPPKGGGSNVKPTKDDIEAADKMHLPIDKYMKGLVESGAISKGE